MSVGPTKGHVAFCWKPTQHTRVKLEAEERSSKEEREEEEEEEVVVVVVVVLVRRCDRATRSAPFFVFLSCCSKRECGSLPVRLSGARLGVDRRPRSRNWRNSSVRREQEKGIIWRLYWSRNGW